MPTLGVIHLIYRLEEKGSSLSGYMTEEQSIARLVSLHIQNKSKYIITLNVKCLFVEMMHVDHLPLFKTNRVLLKGELSCERDVSQIVSDEFLSEINSPLLKNRYIF